MAHGNPRSIADHSPEVFRREMGERYATGETPWDSGIPNQDLLRTIEEGDFPGPTVLELGCGTGTNAIELARRGYRVTAVDLVDLAVDRAREKALRAGAKVDFRVGDLTRMDLGGPYDCLLDVGVYHGIRLRDLAGFLGVIRKVSRPGTRWLSIAGNAREPHPNGPPVVSEAEFRSELGTLFRFLKVRESRFNLAGDFQPLAWAILMERL